MGLFFYLNRIDYHSNSQVLAAEECILVVETPPSFYTLPCSEQKVTTP